MRPGVYVSPTGWRNLAVARGATYQSQWPGISTVRVPSAPQKFGPSPLRLV